MGSAPLTADGPARSTLIGERLHLDVEGVVLPRQLAEAERRRALALIAVLSRLTELAREAKGHLEAEAEPLGRERTESVLKPLAEDERAPADKRMGEAERADLLVRDRGYLGRLRDIHGRYDQAVFVASFARLRAEQMDARVVLHDETTWPAAAQRVAERAARSQ